MNEKSMHWMISIFQFAVLKMVWTILSIAVCLFGLVFSVSASTECWTSCERTACDEAIHEETIHPRKHDAITGSNADLRLSSIEPPSEDEETIESAFFPGMQVPPEVEKALGIFLSQETVNRIKVHDAQGHANEGIEINGQYIPPDMKEVIRNYVHTRNSKNNNREETLLMDPKTAVLGTNFEHPHMEARDSMETDRRKRPAMTSLVAPSWEKVGQLILDGVLKKEVLMGATIMALIVVCVSALLFVYGVSDVYSEMMIMWESTKTLLKNKQSTSKLEVQEDKSTFDKTSKTAPKSTLKKNKDSATHGKSNKKRSKIQHSWKNKNEMTELTEKKASVKSSVSKQKQTKKEASDDDENNEWQEVMHNKPKGRGIRSKTPPEEEKSKPSLKASSQPASPKTPPQSTMARDTESPESAIENVIPTVKPIKTRKPVESSVIDDKSPCLPSLTSSPYPESKTTSNALDPARSAFTTPTIRPRVQQSPFAASTDIPFATGSPLRGGFQSVSHSSEDFQSKVDCLLKNLRAKPFSLHPISSMLRQPLRRSVTDYEDSSVRMEGFNQRHLNGCLDPAFSSSGMLNNHAGLCLPSAFMDEPYAQRSLSSAFSVHYQMQGQRSLPSNPTQNSQFLPPLSHGSAKHPKGIKNALSSDCSLFSSNPSIWSVDLAVDRDFVKSSMRNNDGFRSTDAQGIEQNVDLKRCLPDQLLTEMSS